MMKLLEIQNAIHPESKNRFTQKYSCKLESPQVETPRSCKEKQLEDLLHFGPDNCYQFRGYPMYLAPRTFRGNSECRESPDKGTCSSTRQIQKVTFRTQIRQRAWNQEQALETLAVQKHRLRAMVVIVRKAARKIVKKVVRKEIKVKRAGKIRKAGKKMTKKKERKKA